MIKKLFLGCAILITCTSCTEFALLASGSGIAISQNSYARIYNGLDVLTIISTEKGIREHAYNNMKKALTGAKKGKEYIYDKTWGLTSN